MKPSEMINCRNLVAAAAAALVALVIATGVSQAAEPGLKALLVDGRQARWHDWKTTSPVLKEIIEATGLFQVDRATAPAKGEPIDDFKPDFAKYDVLIMNYDDDDPWPQKTQDAFLDYVRSAGGVVIVHAANNSFPDWKEYNEIIGLGGWRGRDERCGPMVRFRDGEVVLDHSPGPAGTHPEQHEFQVVVRNREHPIMRGLPEKWMNGKDELYSALRGPAKNLTVLATAYADPEKGGTGEHEPILFTVDYGKGRMFHTPLGHGPENMHCVAFIYTLQRGTEWAATGKVTQTTVPGDFPAPDKASYRSSITGSKVQWTDLLNGEDLGAWREPTGEWRIFGDAFTDPENEGRLATKPGTGVAVNGVKGSTRDLVSRLEHGDVDAHIEFMVPEDSNSGVYFQGRYEIQVFDSWGVENPQHSDCGGIYQRWREGPGLDEDERGYEGRPPRVNVSRKPGEWQTFDVIFRAPRFDADGNKVANAVFVKVVHNGIVIHENEEVTGPTRAARFDDEKPTGPLMLQGDHGPVAYRKVRIRPILPAVSAAPSDPYKAIITYDFGQSRRALTTIEEQIRAATPEQREEIEAKLLEALQAPEATFACKQFVCRMLRRVGTSESIPALDDLLADEKLSHMARFALQEMPSPGVDRVFRKALDELSGDLKIGVISSIGARRDRDAVRPISRLVTNRNTAEAEAAISALGRIGGKEAAKALRRAKVADELENLRADAYLMCADSLLAEGKTRAATRMYRRMAGEAKPTMIRIGAYGGMIRALKAKAVPTVVAMLKDKDRDVQWAAGKLATAIPGTPATKALAAQLPTLDPTVQVVLLSSLADRRDKAALPQVVEATLSEDETVRVAALRALAVLGDASNVELLLIKAAKAGGDEGDAAIYALSRLRGRQVDTALIRAVDAEDDPAVRASAVEALHNRREMGVLPTLLKAARDEDSGVREAAYRALGTLAGERELSEMVALLLANENSSERRSLERAMTSVVGRVDADTAVALIIAGLDKADDAAFANLLAVLGRAGGDKAWEFVHGQLESPNLDVRKAAIRAMGNWRDSAPAADLLAIAKSDSDMANQILALRGYVRLVGLPSERPADETLEMYKVAIETAQRPEEKKLVLSGVASLESEEALEFVEQYLEDEEVSEEAERAYERIADSLEE